VPWRKGAYVLEERGVRVLDTRVVVERRCHFERVWFTSCVFQHKVQNRKRVERAPAAVQPHGNPFELTCEPML